MARLKETIKSSFPNLTDFCYLIWQKKNNKKKMNKLLMLDEDQYPIVLTELYKQKTGHELKLDAPNRLTEKIQWRKLYDNAPIYSVLSDKYAVREWIKVKIGEKYLIPLLGVWDHFKDIDFDTFPDQFVLKTNNASHTNIIVTNKKDFLRKKWSIGKRMEYWLKTSFAFLEGLELHYRTIKPKIIAEQFLKPKDGQEDLVDYKFHCFDGRPVLCQVIGERSYEETIDFYDPMWKHVSLRRPPYPNAKEEKDKPVNYDLMLNLASKLSEGFKYVRVDLYEHDSKVYFGEMTFTPASGMMRFEPDEWDYKLGELWDISVPQIDYSIVNVINEEVEQ